LDNRTLGLVLSLLFGAIGALVVWMNHKGGRALDQNGVPCAERTKQPILYWIIQTAWLGLTLMFVLLFLVLAFESD